MILNQSLGKLFEDRVANLVLEIGSDLRSKRFESPSTELGLILNVEEVNVIIADTHLVTENLRNQHIDGNATGLGFGFEKLRPYELFHRRFDDLVPLATVLKVHQAKLAAYLVKKITERDLRVTNNRDHFIGLGDGGNRLGARRVA